MQKAVIVLLLNVGCVAAVAADKAKVFLCLFPAMLAVHNPETLHLRFPVAEVRLAEAPWGKDGRIVQFAKRYHPTNSPSNDGTLPVGFGPRDYEHQLRAFAADKVDERSLTYTSSLKDGTKIKLHLATGELLITNGKGEVGVFAKLPVANRPFGTFSTTGQLFSYMTGVVTAPQKLGEPIQRFAQLTSGEALPFAGFPGQSHLHSHVDKHVLGIFPQQAVSMDPAEKARVAKTKGGSISPEFRDLRRDYLHEIEACKGVSACEAKAYAAVTDKYKDAAEKFMTSDRASILTFTRSEKREDGSSQVVSYRFDTITNELAITNRLTGKVITYYRVEMDTANKFLTKYGYPEVNTPLEYFLSKFRIDYKP